jgi:hypothetical protein
MLTPEQARQDYQTARSALQRALVTPGASVAQRLALQNALGELEATCSRRVEVEVHALAAQYQGFLASMGALVEELARGEAPVAGSKELRELVAQGARRIESAAPVAPGRRTRGARAPRVAPAARRAARALGGEQPLRILCVHGVGHQEGDPSFEATWRESITGGLARWNLQRPFEARFVAYDELFAADPPGPLDLAKAVAKLGASGIVHGIGDFLGGLFHRGRGLGDVSEAVRWSAGMVVQWAEDDRLRKRARERVLQLAGDPDWKPDVVLAHSLGSLLAYDAFARPEGRVSSRSRTFVSFGSQIGNPFVRSVLGGRIRT